LMCFDLSWKTGFLASVMADLLLTLSITCYASPLLNSDINRASQSPEQAAVAAATYSDLQLREPRSSASGTAKSLGCSPERTSCRTYSCVSQRPHPSHSRYSRLGVVHLSLCRTYIHVAWTQ
jgi:hypothetical protein